METISYCSAEIKELAKALINVQRTLQPALKDRENTFAKSRYATFNSVMDSCREALFSNGIWVTQYPVPAEQGHLGLVTKLTHAESGQWQSSLLILPLLKSDPQGYGGVDTVSWRMFRLRIKRHCGDPFRIPEVTCSPGRNVAAEYCTSLRCT